MNITENMYKEDVELFFERIREDSDMTFYQIVDFIKNVASGKTSFLIESDYTQELEEKLKSKTEEVEDLMDALQNMRNDPTRDRNFGDV